ncbi:hypothetical protein D3C79_735140 [compost metagenome]
MTLLLSPPPALQVLVQLRRAVQVLAPGLAEEDQGQFGRDHGIGTGVVPFDRLKAETGRPVVQPGFAQGDLRVQQRRQFGHVEERVLQAIAQVVFQGAAEHALVEGRMKGQYRAVANEGHQVEQRLGRIAASSDGAGPQAMDQDAGGQLVIALVQGALELLAEVDGAVFDDHCANRQDLVALGIQAAGFQVQYHPALAAQRVFAEGGGGCQLCCPLAYVLVDLPGPQPGEQAHS